jgi:hypothetical protein
MTTPKSRRPEGLQYVSPKRDTDRTLGRFGQQCHTTATSRGSNDKAAISGGLVTAEQKGLKSTAFPQERCGLDRRPVSPRYTLTAIGAARIPPRIEFRCSESLKAFSSHNLGNTGILLGVAIWPRQNRVRNNNKNPMSKYGLLLYARCRAAIFGSKNLNAAVTSRRTRK